MKIKNALNLLQAVIMLQSSDVARNVKFGFMLSYNKRLLENVQSSFQDAIKDEAEEAIIQAFEVDRIEMLNKIADKDEHGQPIVNDGVFKITDQDAALVKIRDELLSKHPKAEAAIEHRQNRINELSEEETDVALRKIPLAEWPDLPPDIPPTILDVVMEMIEA